MKLLTQTPDELTQKLQSYLSSNPLYKAIYDYTKQRFDAATDLQLITGRTPTVTPSMLL